MRSPRRAARPRRVLVVGLGSVDRGDDAVGPLVAARVAERSAARGLRRRARRRARGPDRPARPAGSRQRRRGVSRRRDPVRGARRDSHGAPGRRGPAGAGGAHAIRDRRGPTASVWPARSSWPARWTACPRGSWSSGSRRSASSTAPRCLSARESWLRSREPRRRRPGRSSRRRRARVRPAGPEDAQCPRGAVPRTIGRTPSRRQRCTALAHPRGRRCRRTPWARTTRPGLTVG